MRYFEPGGKDFLGGRRRFHLTPEDEIHRLCFTRRCADTAAYTARFIDHGSPFVTEFDRLHGAAFHTHLAPDAGLGIHAGYIV